MKLTAGVFITCTAFNAALAEAPMSRAPLGVDDLRGVKTAIADAKLTCKIDSTDSFGRGDTAMHAIIHCKSSTDKDQRMTNSEIYCDREGAGWTCRLRGTRVRYSRGKQAADFMLDPGITMSDAVQVFDVCLQQEKFRANSIKRSEHGFLASGQEVILMEADVVLSDDPSCIRRTGVTIALPNEPPPLLPPPNTAVKPPAE